MPLPVTTPTTNGCEFCSATATAAATAAGIGAASTAAATLGAAVPAVNATATAMTSPSGAPTAPPRVAPPDGSRSRRLVARAAGTTVATPSSGSGWNIAYNHASDFVPVPVLHGLQDFPGVFILDRQLANKNSCAGEDVRDPSHALLVHWDLYLQSRAVQ